jgi:Na+-transporting NADH:ubiquinone oxidoreductase subunit C
MNKNSVGYILGFCVAICLVCAVVVSMSAVGLKDLQDENKRLDRQKKVLVVAGLLEEGAQATPDEISSLFKKRIKPVMVNLKTGQVDEEATKAVADYDQTKASKDPALSEAVEKNLAGVPRVPKHAIVFLVSKTDIGEDGVVSDPSQYILPVEGKGLWSTLYGYVSLARDLNEINGLTFYQHAETPGLGGEVDNPSWKAKWPGRRVYSPDGKIAIKVKKGAAGSVKEDPHQVDGLSGATITSNGVTYLLAFWLGEQGFGPYIKNLKGAGVQLGQVTQ